MTASDLPCDVEAPDPEGVVAILDRNPMSGEARVGGKRFWTGREQLILRNFYPTEGLAGCVSRLQGRTAKAIYQQARLHGLVAPGGARHDGLPRQSWPQSDAIDAVIRQAYPRAVNARDVSKLAQTVGRPRWWVSKRAARLGLVTPRFRPEPWSEAEDSIISERAHQDAQTLKKRLASAGFSRTETAILVRLKRLGVDRTDPDHFTGCGLASVMGVDFKTVSRWIVNGLLVAKRRGTDRVAVQGGDEWWIHRRDVRSFIIENPASVDVRKVDKFWFIDLLGTRS